MAGNELNRREKRVPMACNACCPAPSGTPMECAMTCAPTSLPHLGGESAILVIDESCFPKRGDKSAGVGLQYCGTTGQVENCQVGVFLSSVTARGHALIDRELYVPLDWIEDRD